MRKPRRVRGICLAVLGVACGPPPRPDTLPAEPVLIDKETYEHRIAGLRATLARSHVELDTVPVIDTCGGHIEDGHSRCVHCELVRRDDTEGFDPDMIDSIAIAFATYSPQVIAASKLEHVALCKSIRLSDQPDDPPGGLAMSDQHRLLLSIESFRGSEARDNYTIEQIVHHELFHLLDRATGLDPVWDAKWAKLNPPGFGYRDPADGAERPYGFVNSYATTNEFEDRASTYEFIMGQPAKLCELVKADPLLAVKVRTLWKRVAAIAGEDFLPRHAPCLNVARSR